MGVVGTGDGAGLLPVPGLSTKDLWQFVMLICP